MTEEIVTNGYEKYLPITQKKNLFAVIIYTNKFLKEKKPKIFLGKLSISVKFHNNILPLASIVPALEIDF